MDINICSHNRLARALRLLKRIQKCANYCRLKNIISCQLFIITRCIVCIRNSQRKRIWNLTRNHRIFSHKIKKKSEKIVFYKRFLFVVFCLFIDLFERKKLSHGKSVCWQWLQIMRTLRSKCKYELFLKFRWMNKLHVFLQKFVVSGGEQPVSLYERKTQQLHE